MGIWIVECGWAVGQTNEEWGPDGEWGPNGDGDGDGDKFHSPAGNRDKDGKRVEVAGMGTGVCSPPRCHP